MTESIENGDYKNKAYKENRLNIMPIALIDRIWIIYQDNKIRPI